VTDLVLFILLTLKDVFGIFFFIFDKNFLYLHILQEI